SVDVAATSVIHFFHTLSLSRDTTMGRLTSTILYLVCLWAAPALADDWPQWMGPKRDNIWRESDLLETFPEGGPRIVWRAPVAGGYAGPAVAGGRLFVTDYVTVDNVKTDNFDRKESTGVERIL